MSKRKKTLDQMTVVNPNAAGLDIGSREIWACVGASPDGECIKQFGTFTPDLQRLADWLVACQVKTVALESTGLYWLAIFEILEGRGLKVWLVNARHIKNVPGRKSDYLDCQWIHKLHALGLLNASFRPDGEMCALRAYLRHRAQLIQHRAPHILHMQKALQQMNLQLHHVLSNITGATGMAILRAIVAGERDAVTLAQFRDPACKSSEETIANALTGEWKNEHLFALKQSLELYDFYTQQVAACDIQIQQQFSTMKPRWEIEAQPLTASPAKANSKMRSRAAAHSRAELLRIAGVDLVAVDGLNISLAQTILSEIGTDMSKWPTAKHFASWLGLAPHNDISGGKVLRSRTLPSQNRAGQAFRQAAAAVSRTPSAFGAFYRRKRAQLGPQQAQAATAHKIARTVYYLLKHHVPYHDIGADRYELTQRERDIVHLRKRAAKLGLTLSEHDAA